MLTTLDSSPTSCSGNAVLSSPTTECSSTTTEQNREQLGSPPSSKQEMFLAKRPSSRTKHRHQPYPYPDCSAKSPESCSSDGDSVQSDDDNTDGSGRPCKVKRVAANSRERKRMHTVNSAFDQLRELVPTYPSNRKLSKIDTLRLACTYIQDLVSLLHNSQGIQGEDVSVQLYHHQQHPFPDTTFNGYPVKQEMAEFAPFTASPEHFRMQTAACLRFPGHPDGCSEPYGSSASESDSTTHSPPHGFMQQNVPQQPQAPPPPPASSRPPPLTRVSSEATASIHTRMAEASISNGGAQVSPLVLPPPPPPTSMYQRQVNITSPLAMHSVHHNTLHASSLEHHSPPPIWQRPSPVPNGFACALYGQ